MRDPERLSSGRGVTTFERGLLDAARNERLPDEMKQRMERALGLLGGATTGAAVGTAAALTARNLVVTSAAPSASLAGGQAARWAGDVAGNHLRGNIGGKIGGKIVLAGKATGGVAGMKLASLLAISAGVVTLGLLGAVGFRHHTPEPPAANALVASAIPSPSPSSPSSSPSTPAAKLRSSRRHPPVPVAAPVATSDHLRAEIAFIDDARADLHAGATSRALEVLRRYTTRFPRGALAPEAVALRVEALVRADRRDEARTVARQFLAANPTSPLAPRIRALAQGATRP